LVKEVKVMFTLELAMKAQRGSMGVQERKILPPSGFDPQTPASSEFLYQLCYILLVGRRGNFGTTILDVSDFDTKLIIKH